MNTAWECRDQADQAEIYYNHPQRVINRRLEEENLALKRLLREHGISWQAHVAPPVPSTPAILTTGRVTRSRTTRRHSLPHLPVEVQLRILSYAVTSPQPIIDPLCKLNHDNITAREKTRTNQIAIHFLATCRAYHTEGTKLLWSNNTFLFTTPEAVKNFADVPSLHRHKMKDATFRIIARFYDDEERSHRLPSNYHPDFKKPVKLRVQRRPKEPTMARRGFRSYAWYQLVDFLEALLPPYQPPTLQYKSSMDDLSALTRHEMQPRPRLLPSLERLRIDFVSFGEDMLQFPPAQLHDLASHHLGRTLNEVILTGLPSDDAGFRVSTELGGLLRDEGLLIDHAPLMVTQKNGIRHLPCDDERCHYSSKVVRAMHSEMFHDHHDHHDHAYEEFPAVPVDEGQPPDRDAHSCRTIWKRVPVKLDDPVDRRWELYDRVSGMPWDEVAEDVTMFDDVDSDGEGMTCENCGEIHPGAIPPEDLMDLYDDL